MSDVDPYADEEPLPIDYIPPVPPLRPAPDSPKPVVGAACPTVPPGTAPVYNPDGTYGGPMPPIPRPAQWQNTFNYYGSTVNNSYVYLIDQIGDRINTSISEINEVVEYVVNNIITTINDVVNVVTELLEFVTNEITTTISTVSELVSTVVNQYSQPSTITTNYYYGNAPPPPPPPPPPPKCPPCEDEDEEEDELTCEEKAFGGDYRYLRDDCSGNDADEIAGMIGIPLNILTDPNAANQQALSLGAEAFSGFTRIPIIGVANVGSP